MKAYKILLVAFLLIHSNSRLFAEDFYLDSPSNKGTLRFEVDNDAVWEEDSNFSNGLSFQYHTVRYANWEEVKAPGFVKWVGKNFPSLDDDGSVVRNSYGIGQNMITPGDLDAEVLQGGDLPYAGTLTYTLNWQTFNRETAHNFQVSVGLLGQESLGEQFQKCVHNNLGLGHDPKGWDTQRDTEPILNIGYQYAWRLGYLGEYNNGWAGQLALAPSAHLGNLITAGELDLSLRFGWNILEGFNTYLPPPGRGFFQSSYLPKPSSASAHGVEVIFGVRGTGLLYSVIYDGSFITGDDRNVDRNDFFFTGGLGINYHYYDFLSIRASIQQSTDVLNEDSIPDPPSGREKTQADVSFGSLIIDFHF